jgi:hypothetical protein
MNKPKKRGFTIDEIMYWQDDEPKPSNRISIQYLSQQPVILYPRSQLLWKPGDLQAYYSTTMAMGVASQSTALYKKHHWQATPSIVSLQRTDDQEATPINNVQKLER